MHSQLDDTVFRGGAVLGRSIALRRGKRLRTSHRSGLCSRTARRASLGAAFCRAAASRILRSFTRSVVIRAVGGSVRRLRMRDTLIHALILGPRNIRHLGWEKDDKKEHLAPNDLFLYRRKFA